MTEKKYSLKEEWMPYYQTLEQIRLSGIINMFGAAPYLAAMENIDEETAKTVLLSWMNNYAELAERNNWR